MPARPKGAVLMSESNRQTAQAGDNVPGLVAELWAIHESMDDHGTCPYLRRGEEDQDPNGICSFGCRDEPSCQTDYDPQYPWPSVILRDLIGRIEQVGWAPPGVEDFSTGAVTRHRIFDTDQPVYRVEHIAREGRPT